MTTYILANWKCNKTRKESIDWLETFLEMYEPKPHLEIIIAPPFIVLDPLKQVLDKQAPPQVHLASQDISPFPTGSYTGAIAADMLTGVVDFAIIGHSERRRHFHETHTEIARKAREAQEAGLTPILCIDLPYGREQIAALDRQTLKNNLLIGFGPFEAISLDIAPPSESKKEVIAKIKQLVPDQPILYGGSINSENAEDYLSLPELSGLMVGSACMNPVEFARLCNNIA